MTQRAAQIGSVSSGTLATEDLMEAFMWEVNHLAPGVYNDLLEECGNCLNSEDDKEPNINVQRLIDILTDLAPPYCYFGAHEGDGADFGFWPMMGVIEDLPRVENSEQAKALGEDCAFVNDHGNVTVFDGNGAVLLELV